MSFHALPDRPPLPVRAVHRSGNFDLRPSAPQANRPDYPSVMIKDSLPFISAAMCIADMIQDSAAALTGFVTAAACSRPAAAAVSPLASRLRNCLCFPQRPLTYTECNG
jgi:hypothetical protein